MNGLKGLIRSALLAAGDAVALIALWPDWARLSHDLAAPHRWLDRAGADEAALTLATAALWCVALWLAIGLGALAAATLPGHAGAAARRIAAQLLPAVLLRAVAGVAGLGVLVAPVAPAAAGASPPPHAAPVAAAVVPTPVWPTDEDPVPGVHIGWPTNPPALPPAAPRPSGPPPAPTRSATGDDQGVPRPSGDQSLRVRSGDSLWLIAARRLGPDASDAQIAGAWPGWYAANRRVIGDDPSLIEPGQVLHAPQPSDASR